MARKSLLEQIEALEEPRTRARVEGLIDELWPTRYSYRTWVTSEEPRRHVALLFGRRVSSRVCFEGSGATWREAFIAVEKQRLAHQSEAK